MSRNVKLALVAVIVVAVMMCLSSRMHRENGQMINLAHFQMTHYSAQHGDAGSQYALGSFYERGAGVPKNAEAAVRWYREASEQGNANAMSSLAYCYWNGTGIAHDWTKAIALWTQSAERGYPPAQVALAVRYDQGWGVPQDLPKAIYWYTQAAETDSRLEFILGAYHEVGRGVPKDMDKALYWYLRAANRRLPEAIAALHRFAAMGYVKAQEALVRLEPPRQEQLPSDEDEGVT